MKPSNREPTFVEMLFQEAMLDIEARTSPIPQAGVSRATPSTRPRNNTNRNGERSGRFQSLPLTATYLGRIPDSSHVPVRWLERIG
jgi:hypothetical protein